MLKRMMFLFLCGMFLSGCAKQVHKDWTPTGGSRADATVRLSYEHTDLEDPITNNKQALDLANAKCQSWGYVSAEPFGGATRICNQMGFGWASGCISWLVTKEFQCIGQGTEISSSK